MDISSILPVFKNHSNIISNINYYLNALALNNNILLNKDNENYQLEYSNNLAYLFNNNIIIKYALEYARYPKNSMIFMVELSKLINQDDAFEILMNIPIINIPLYLKKITDKNKIHKLLNYNFSWSIILLNKNINIILVKTLLREFVDFYFFELFRINENINDFNKSFQIMIENIDKTLKYKYNYYKLITSKVQHFNAYLWCKYSDNIIERIIDFINHDYNKSEILSICMFLNDNQIDFLKLSRLGYRTFEEFDKEINNIFIVSITMPLILS